MKRPIMFTSKNMQQTGDFIPQSTLLLIVLAHEAPKSVPLNYPHRYQTGENINTKPLDNNINRLRTGKTLCLIAVMAIVAVTQTALAGSEVQALKKRDITPS